MTRRMFRRAPFPRLFPVLASLAAAAVLAGCTPSPLTGREQLLLLSESQEIQMGKQSWKAILKKYKPDRDRRHNALVQRVLGRIATATGRTDYAWEFAVIDNDKVANAFALPGGKVAVYSGLFPIAKNEAGLATVIGHEVAHAIARHGGERVSQQLLVNLSLAAVRVAMSRQDGETVRQVSVLLGAGAAVGVLLPFSRRQESEADRIGLIYMAKAGYDPREAIPFWNRMQAQARGKRAPPEFLSTHPSSRTRIAQIRSWLPEAMRYYRRAQASARR